MIRSRSVLTASTVNVRAVPHQRTDRRKTPAEYSEQLPWLELKWPIEYDKWHKRTCLSMLKFQELNAQRTTVAGTEGRVGSRATVDSSSTSAEQHMWFSHRNSRSNSGWVAEEASAAVCSSSSSASSRKLSCGCSVATQQFPSSSSPEYSRLGEDADS